MPVNEANLGSEPSDCMQAPQSVAEAVAILKELAAGALVGSRPPPAAPSVARHGAAGSAGLPGQRPERELHLAEARYRALVEQIPAVTFVASLQGGVNEIYVSPQIEALLGFSQQEWARTPCLWIQQMHAHDRLELSAQFMEACTDGRPMRGTVRMRSRQGETVWVHGEARFVWDDAGRPLFLQGVAFDITERKKSELALAESEERFRVALESSAVGFSILRAVRDEQGRIVDFEWTYANPAAVRLMRRPPGKLIGGLLTDRVSGLSLGSPEFFAALVHVVESGEAADIEAPAESPEGDLWVRNVVAKLGDGIAAWTMDETERKRGQEALREADRRKDQFVATLAHELRNPLAPIRQAAAVSRMPSATEDQLRWSHEVIERQVRHMSLLLDDLLDISRITRGRLELRKTSVDLVSAIQAAIEPVQPLIEERQHRLTLEAPPAGLRLEADPLRLSQMVSNLLTNAAKYTEPGGKIQLTAWQEGDTVVIRVADTGIGIPRDAMPRIFEMFSQVPSEMGLKGEGLGIGLALSKGLVELHGGSIAVHSEGPGRGSEFTIRLPTGTTRHPDPISGRPPEPQVSPRCRVLVADDNRDAAKTLAMLAQLYGCDVRTAFDGAEALAVAASFRPQLALVDIGMPKLNGYEVAERLREQPWGRDITLIAVTGWGNVEDKRRSAAAGFNQHLTKPIDPAVFGSLLSSIDSP